MDTLRAKRAAENLLAKKYGPAVWDTQINWMPVRDRLQARILRHYDRRRSATDFLGFIAFSLAGYIVGQVAMLALGLG